MRFATALATLFVAAAIPVSAQADIFAAVTNTNSQNFEPGPFGIVVDGAAGKTTISFKTTEPKRVIISFYAECAVDGLLGSYVDIDILVDPAGEAGFAAIPPTDSDNAMCSGFEVEPDESSNGWVAAVVSGVVEVPKGTHKIKVRGNLDGGNLVRFDDILLTVMD
jgi:hypothetical protein